MKMSYRERTRLLVLKQAEVIKKIEKYDKDALTNKIRDCLHESIMSLHDLSHLHQVNVTQMAFPFLKQTVS